MELASERTSPTKTEPFSAFVLIPLVGLTAGLVARLFGYDALSGPIWAAATIPVLVALIFEIWRSLHAGKVGLDIVAALSMSAALAVGEYLAAAIVALMYSGGQYLENYAERRARRDMSLLLERVPRFAMRYGKDGLERIPIASIAPGDRLMIRLGDIVPVDGQVAEKAATLDQSALTGESVPVRLDAGADVMSGSTNAGEAFDLIASRPASESTYAAIVRLVEQAQQSRAPMSRLADRYSLVFLAVTVLLAGGAWLLTSDPVRAVAVLVVATPCPLILAVPIAWIAGMSRAARSGILIKSGAALELMGRTRVLVIDKTGTLTVGRPEVKDVLTSGDAAADEVLRLAASLDQASKHVVADAIVADARARGLTLSVPTGVAETPGDGLTGMVDGRRVSVGGRGYVSSQIGTPIARPATIAPGTVTVSVGIDGVHAAEIVMADRLRSGTDSFLRNVRRLGIERIVLATGDRADIAKVVAGGLDIDEIRAELTPDQKVMVVLSERKYGPVLMAGDGVNDAPALAAADVGVAMGARGAAASAQAADVVLLVDHVDRIVPAMSIAKRSRNIALQSVIAGLGLSGLAMVAAAFGYLPPVQGAILQEVIDVTVIANALRALGGKTEPSDAG
ncbi:heavy metal translocating P-type ATPase [Pseudorhodoplanes sp.]|uniref:heavy metal translocating P-type ATPase n=1 Tax=Pseudorhodoplanes sp. TaxID=1934341 RepID=UPI002CBEB3C7|nr:heavy metal translocating P-type ATPase [Pseudorhodoplanes sp.]HWV53363.1 heavy metal translocating P-type ATPase [Pseudorhodoplanes sp.]